MWRALSIELGIRLGSLSLVRLKVGVGILLSRELFFLPLSPDAMEVVLIFLCSLLAPAVLASGKYA